LKCDGTRAETRFRLSAKRTSPFKSAGASVQSIGTREVPISGSNAEYTMFRGSVKSNGYPLHSPVSPSLPLPCVTVCHHLSFGLYHSISPGSRQVCMFRDYDSFYGQELSAPRPTLKLEDRPLSAVRDYLFNTFAATLHTRGHSSIHNTRTRYDTVTATHLSWDWTHQKREKSFPCKQAIEPQFLVQPVHSLASILCYPKSQIHVQTTFHASKHSELGMTLCLLNFILVLQSFCKPACSILKI
jgi:hypothetical protein